MPLDSHQLSSALQTLTFCQIMGCNASRGTTVVDPSEKPEERPKTATSTKEASAEESNGTTNKDKDENAEGSS
ncbi:retinoblastoma-like protein 2 isoform X1 [Lates japonicus]|uniref:Retinoblastoma-like protein 2 isoform X1 n=1 Tax=Lates japonicus TaxID=270547 RepID=A0AAD3MRR7_LATJO|nr:retinoblastoma-like protein 2 isoform X1 [Lates japonicus]